jgi:CheY-like chemotaxis protein
MCTINYPEHKHKMATILLVDDHPDVRDVIGQLLEMHGHSVVVAESAERAWELLRQASVDAVVVDQSLPGMTGIELLRRIRESPNLARVMVIVCSGDDTERATALAVGAADFWVKGSNGMFDAVSGLGERLSRA